MRILQLICVVAVLYYGYQKWHSHKILADAMATADASSGGFISVKMPDGASANQVLIFAPLNCPSEAAQRADKLATQLNQMGIANTRSAHFQLSFSDPAEVEQASVVRTEEVMKGEIPAVFINGRGKANPSLEDVVAEFKRSQP